VARFDLKTGEQTSLWDLGRAGTGPEAWDIGDGWLTSSPDGREVAVALTAVRPVHQSLGPGERTRHLLLVLAADGSSASVTQVSEDARSFFTGDLAWSGDGRTLYFVSGSSSGRLGAKMRATVWRAGTGRTAAVTLPGREGLAWTAVLPDGRLFLWSGSRAWMMDPDGRVTRLPTSAETALADSNLAGVDRQGRLIVGKWKGDEPSYLAALDLNTGKLTRIYP
jgi:outer membrane protein assembly factor BamB